MALIRAIVTLARASHPLPTLAVTAGGAALAVATGRDGPGVAAVALTILASQLAVGWHNDWLDAGRDRAALRRDKPIACGQVPARRVGWAAAIAAAVTVPLGLLSGPAAALAVAIGLVSALAYNWPLKFTPLSALPYVVSFAALPVFVLLGRPEAGPVPWWLVTAGATLGAGAHFANVLPDLDDDLRQGVRGLPQRLGARASAAIAALLVMAVSLLLTFGPDGPPLTAGLVSLPFAAVALAAGGYLQWRRPQSRAAFRAVLLVAMVDVGLLLIAGTLLDPAAGG